MKTQLVLTLFSLVFLLVACDSNSPENTEKPPSASELPQVPNCAADGPECKQFNPDLK